MTTRQSEPYEMTAVCSNCDEHSTFQVTEERQTQHYVDDRDQPRTRRVVITRMRCHNCGHKVVNSLPESALNY